MRIHTYIYKEVSEGRQSMKARRERLCMYVAHMYIYTHMHTHIDKKDSAE